MRIRAIKSVLTYDGADDRHVFILRVILESDEYQVQIPEPWTTASVAKALRSVADRLDALKLIKQNQRNSK